MEYAGDGTSQSSSSPAQEGRDDQWDNTGSQLPVRPFEQQHGQNASTMYKSSSRQNLVDADKFASMRERNATSRPASREETINAGSFASMRELSAAGVSATKASLDTRSLSFLGETQSNSMGGSKEVDRKSVRPVLRPSERPISLQQAIDYFGGDGE